MRSEEKKSAEIVKRAGQLSAFPPISQPRAALPTCSQVLADEALQQVRTMVEGLSASSPPSA